jgi:hypothetical protein
MSDQKQTSENEQGHAPLAGVTHSVADFALRLSTVLLKNQSSTALFFVQQAYEDDGDGLEGLQQSTEELLKTVQTNAKLLLQHCE